MTFHSPRQMLAIGPHGEISQRFPGGNSYHRSLGPCIDAKRSPGRGECRGFSGSRLVSGGDIANPTLGNALYIVKQPLRSSNGGELS
jgi:hypothetical protein